MALPPAVQRQRGRASGDRGAAAAWGSGHRPRGVSRARWVGLERSDRRLLQLGPIGVLPEHQGRGLGSELVRATLDAARALGEPLVLLEGDPAYYGRFGFVRADELGLLPPPQARDDWAFQVAVVDADVPLPQGRVVYPPAFPAP